jgi:hypothetical protein
MSKGSGDSAEGAPAPTSKPRLWIINIPDLQFFELSATDDGSDPLADGAVAKVRQVVDDFQNEKLELKPISH